MIEIKRIKDRMIAAEQEPYYVTYGCTNCRKHSNVHFERGQSAPETVKCPKCGCEGAKKTW